jgi:hypothetical protein
LYVKGFQALSATAVYGAEARSLIVAALHALPADESPSPGT